MIKKFSSLGVIHIHTKFSDGSGDIEEISLAAKKAGLNWIIVSDHNDFSVDEGIYNDILVIKGEEISPNIGYHTLAFDINEKIQYSDNPVENITNVHNQGGFCFAAHPDESDKRKNPNKPLKWLDKKIVPDGIEIWNWFSDWANRYNSNDIFHVAYAFLFRKKLIRGIEPETRMWWDRINNEKPEIFPAIAGTDAHALKIKNYIIPVTVFPYEYCFKTAANLILTDKPLSQDFQTAKIQILQAIKKGNNILLNRKKCKEHEVVSMIVRNGTMSVSCGDRISLDENTELHLNIPDKAEVSLYCDGHEIKCEKTDKFLHNIKNRGKYRIEVYNGRTPVLYTNPILVV